MNAKKNLACIVFCIVQLVNGRMIIGILFIGSDTYGFLPPLPHTHTKHFLRILLQFRACVCKTTETVSALRTATGRFSTNFFYNIFFFT